MLRRSIAQTLLPQSHPRGTVAAGPWGYRATANRHREAHRQPESAGTRIATRMHEGMSGRAHPWENGRPSAVLSLPPAGLEFRPTNNHTWLLPPWRNCHQVYRRLELI